MLTALHSVVVDVADFDEAVRDYVLLLGRAPIGAPPDPAQGTLSVRFALANAELELRGVAGGPGPALAVGGRQGIAGLRFTCRPTPASRLLPGRLEGPTIPIELVAEADPSPASKGPPSSHSMTWASHRWGGRLRVDPEEGVAALDHVVIVTPDPERTRRYFAEELGIRLALDRSFAERGLRLIFFRVGGVTIEVASSLGGHPAGSRRDAFQGLAWKVTRIEAIHARLRAEGFDVSEIRSGYKAGTRVATVRGPVHGVPTLLIEHPPRARGRMQGAGDW